MIVSIYATHEGAAKLPARFNRLGGAVFVGRGPDGVYSINVVTSDSQRVSGQTDGWSLVDRDELRLLRDALTAELDRQ